jgi:transcriptional regulator with XRE-family HTH domain
VLLPAQIRSLRLRRGQKQADLGEAVEMKQARISKLEQIGAANFSIETLIRLASAFRVGLIVKFVPYSEMLEWENEFQPDAFDAAPIEEDGDFITSKNHPVLKVIEPVCSALNEQPREEEARVN